MKIFICLLLCLTFTSMARSQPLYFPPFPGNEWETIDVSDLNWNHEAIGELNEFLEEAKTKAFLVLVDGKIAIEEYFGNFSQDSFWYWASAGKGMTAFLTGIAQSEGQIAIQQPASEYLGSGWTSLDPEKEELILVENLLTMTSGLDFNVPDQSCTLDTCFQYLEDAGSFWYYYNAPYTMLSYLIEEATNQGINGFLFSRLTTRTGIGGLYLNIGFNRVMFSNARSFARFGLLCLADGYWDGVDILGDRSFFEAMVNTSQPFNLSYGYLWWLNGKESFMIPQSTNVFNGNFAPESPDDMYAAIGLNGQILMVIPSKNMVIVRMGDNPDNVPVPFLLVNDIWKKMNRVLPLTGLVDHEPKSGMSVFPNPFFDEIRVEIPEFAGEFLFEILDMHGRVVDSGISSGAISLRELKAGNYLLRVLVNEEAFYSKLIKK